MLYTTKEVSLTCYKREYAKVVDEIAKEFISGKTQPNRFRRTLASNDELG